MMNVLQEMQRKKRQKGIGVDNCFVLGHLKLKESFHL